MEKYKQVFRIKKKHVLCKILHFYYEYFLNKIKNSFRQEFNFHFLIVIKYLNHQS